MRKHMNKIFTALVATAIVSGLTAFFRARRASSTGA